MREKDFGAKREGLWIIQMGGGPYNELDRLNNSSPAPSTSTPSSPTPCSSTPRTPVGSGFFWGDFHVNGRFHLIFLIAAEDRGRKITLFLKRFRLVEVNLNETPERE
jgi:hypothetical protein